MNLLCLRCREVTPVTDEELEVLEACPTCGDNQGVPADADDTVTLTLTKQELRILTYWATNWARMVQENEMEYDAMRVVTGITDHLARYTDVALTLSQDLADIQSRFPAMKIMSVDEFMQHLAEGSPEEEEGVG